MRNTVRRRIAALERRSSGGLACPMCGHDPNAPIRYEIVWEAEEDVDEPPVSSPPCPTCLYRSLTVIDWEEVVTDPERERANREHRRSLEERRAEYLEGRPDLTERQTLHDYPPESWDEGEARGYEALRGSKRRRKPMPGEGYGGLSMVLFPPSRPR